MKLAARFGLLFLLAGLVFVPGATAVSVLPALPGTPELPTAPASPQLPSTPEVPNVSAMAAAAATAAQAAASSTSGATAKTTTPGHTTVAPKTGGGPPRFDGGQILKGQGGGEPSLAIDTSPTASRNDIYVDAIGGWGSSPPAGDPAGAGPVLWHSYDGGKTFSAPVPFDTGAQDTATEGGDADTTVAPNGNVIVTDLNVSYTWVQVSTDHGQSFDTGTATAPEDDRPWLTTSLGNVYVAYHDFAAELPAVCTSLDGGHTFLPCNYATITNPQIAAQCAENTIPARSLAVDPTTGSLNFLFSCSTANENLQHPPYGPLHDYYLAQSTDGGLTWHDYTVFQADTSGGKAPNYANIFGTLAIDSAGNYYVLLDGTANDNNPTANPYHVDLLTSTDHGRTWSGPKQVDHDANGAGTHVLAHLAVTQPGNVDIAWYGTSATGEPNGVCGTVVSQSPCTDSSGKPDGFALYSASNAPAWQIYMTQTTDALAAKPHFTQAAASGTIHYGEICTNGIVCGSSDRTLLDFLSIGVDCNGLAHLAFAGNTKQEEAADFTNGGANIHAVNQTGGGTIAPPSVCSSTP